LDLRELEGAIQAFRVLDPTHLPAHHIAVFLVVAQEEPCTFALIEQRLGLSTSAVSRTIHALGDEHRKGRQGFRLVTVEKDPKEGRRFIAMLTPRGQALKRQLLTL